MRPTKTGSGASARVDDLKDPTAKLEDRTRHSGATASAPYVKGLEAAGIAHRLGAGRGGSGRTASAKD
jgi:hypothetical protein